MVKKRINIFGVSGSIGQSTLEVFRESKSIDQYEFVVFSANENVEQLIKDSLEFKPKYAVIGNPGKYKALRDGLAGTNIEASAGKNSIIDLASQRVDWSMSAIIGFAGVEVTLKCAEFSNVLALANKEALVCAGKLLLSKVKKYNNALIPVDSEHSAIFQCLEGENPSSVKSITLTASGGPFRDWTLEEIGKATLQDALKHPNWSMGDKITVDSASMFNKSLELIEAMHLFGLSYSEIDIVIHPQSIVHSMVNFVDGTTMAQLSIPDMKGPIGYALNYPKRNYLNLETINFSKVGRLEFYNPDKKKFHSLKVVEKVARNLDLGVIFNAAKETALERFILGEISFLDMAFVVEKTLSEKSLVQLSEVENQSLSSLLNADIASREFSRTVKL